MKRKLIKLIMILVPLAIVLVLVFMLWGIMMGPPVHRNSDLFWHELNGTMLLYSSGVGHISGNQIYSSPELWELKNDKWIKLAEYPEMTQEYNVCAYDPENNILVAVYTTIGETWIFDDDKWKRSLDDTIIGDNYKSLDLIFNRADARFELYNFSLQKRWYLNGANWVEDLDANISPLPLEGYIPYYHAFYDLSCNRILSYGSTEGKVRHVLLGLNNGEWSVILDPYPIRGGDITGFVWSPGDKRLFIIGTSPDYDWRLYIAELKEDDFKILPSKNPPVDRSFPSLGYDPSKERIIVYGGWGEVLPCKDTWEAIYSEDKKRFVWKQID